MKGRVPKPPQSGVVIGSGPNGLTAAIVLAQAGLRVTIFEAEPVVGGGVRSAEHTLAGFVHDICSAVHPLAVSSPAFASFPLAQHCLEWIHPPVPLAHPLDNGAAVVLERSLEGTSARLGADGPVYRRALRILVKRGPELMAELLQPVLHFPSRPLLLARCGALAPGPAAAAARLLFRAEPARALFAGAAAHSILPLQAPGGRTRAAQRQSRGRRYHRGREHSAAVRLPTHAPSLSHAVGRCVLVLRFHHRAEEFTEYAASTPPRRLSKDNLEGGL